MLSCCGFHEQHIPRIASVSDLSPNLVYSLEIMEGFDYGELRHKKKKVNDSFALDASTVDVQAKST